MPNKNHKICPECGFESGHSRACPKFKEVEFEMPNKKPQSWEEEFDKNFA